MNKKEASEFVGISVRQIENYAKKGKLSVRYEKGKTGDVAVFDERELKALRRELDSKRTPRPSVVPDAGETGESSELVRASDSRFSDFSKLAEALISLSAPKKLSKALQLKISRF